MKVKNLILIVFVLLCTSCDFSEIFTNSGGGGNVSRYNQSFNTWESLKKLNGNSYVYRATSGSWTGYGSTTEIKVIDGVITSRIYKYFHLDGGTGNKETIESYAENSEELGNNQKGAQLLTMDQLYELCIKVYMNVDKEDNDIYFEADKNGLIKYCGYVPKNCVDDCFNGICIDYFEWLKTDSIDN